MAARAEAERYYYNGDEKIALEPEPSVYAIRRSPSRARLSARADELLEASEPVDFVAKYGLSIQRTAEGEAVAGRLEELGDEDGIELATVAYRATRGGEDLMFPLDRFTAQFRPEVTREQIDALNAKHGVRVIEPLGYARNGFLLQAPAASGERGAIALANRYHETGLTRFAKPDFVRPLHQRQATTATPREVAPREETAEFLDRQWHLALARVTDAWDAHGTGAANIWVCVMDDGIDVDHPALAPRLVAQFDFEADVADARPKLDRERHGTPCAGVATGSGAPDGKAPGAAPTCGLIAVRAPRRLADADMARMFQWAADEQADVISCSWGPPDNDGPAPLPADIAAAIDHCVTEGRGGSGIPVLFAAGNGDELVSDDGYAANPQVMAIAASTEEDTKAPYSDFGPEIFLCAPSSGDGAQGHRRIFTVDRRGALGYNPGTPDKGDAAGDYTNGFGGTSSATPLVAGTIGLMLSVNPALTEAEVREILRMTAVRIGPASGYDAQGHSDEFGFGRLDAAAAVQEAFDRSQGGGGGSPQPSGPSISAPDSVAASGPAPTFTFDPSPHPVGIVEVASDPALFVDEAGRTDATYYGAWAEGFQSGPRYTLPDAVWRRLSGGDALFYRLWTSASSAGWEDVQVTTPDEDAASAPSIAIEHDAPAVPDSVRFPSGATFAVVEDPQDAVDYSDPVAGGAVPLIDVGSRRRERLSANFTVGELAASDGARYARISPELVAGLQRLRERVGKAVRVNSGYRHPALNAAKDGAERSRHMAGQAADVRVDGVTPLELARLALEEVGTDIGIGLGRGSIHVDVRGTLTSWVYRGAELDEAQFDAWVREQAAELGRTVGDRDEGVEGGLGLLGPEEWDRTGSPPAFTVLGRPGQPFVVEVARLRALLGSRARLEDGLWRSPVARVPAAGATAVVLAEEAWRALAGARRLHVRAVPPGGASAGREHVVLLTGGDLARDELAGAPVRSEDEAAERDERRWQEPGAEVREREEEGAGEERPSPVTERAAPPALDAALRAEYERLWATCTVRPEREAAVDDVVRRILAERGRYEAVQAAVGVPWHVVAAIHSLESNLRFDRHLHNGDPLTARTTHVPAGRPLQGSPPFTWEESALDALRMHGMGTWTDWSVAATLYQLERYNGFGYRMYHPTVLSPYLWSFTTHYDRGKYVADGTFSATAVSAQCGAAAILRRLVERGEVVLGAPGGRPSIRGPEVHARDDGPPSFEIDPGPGAAAMVEIAAGADLLLELHAASRDPSTYYASWEPDGEGFTAHSPYTLPDAAWERLRHNDRLVYRVWTSASFEGWVDTATSTPDDEVADAPVLRIV